MSENQNPVTAPIDGMKAMAHAIGNLPSDHAMYRREKLPTPVQDSFGTHTEKRSLVQGRAKVLEEVGEDRVLMFSIRLASGDKKVVGIGKTPDEWDPARGGQKMLGAGRDNTDADTYLMLVHQGDDSVPPKPIYLSESQLADISVAPEDENLTLNPYMESASEGRVIRIEGTIESVAILE
jgi:hypothetical protein